MHKFDDYKNGGSYMRKFTLIISLLLVVAIGWSYDKTKYDLDFKKDQDNSLSKSTGRNTSNVILKNNGTEVTLLSNGYFTIGTVDGVSQSNLDDNCQLTFGHPYAMTSYPFFMLDGAVQYLEDYFYDEPYQLTVIGDTLRLISGVNSIMKLQFDLIQKNNGGDIGIEYSITNQDTIGHNIGLGIMFDPALGKWGDGYCFINGESVSNDNLIESSIPDNFEIWEREVSPKGIGLQLSFGSNLPEKLHIGNWINLHNNQEVLLNQLYDLAIKMNWDEVQVLPLQKNTCSLDLTLLSPDFPNGLFLRTDIPQFLSIENDLLFPALVTSLVDVSNAASVPFQNIKFEIDGAEVINDWVSADSFSINSGETIPKNVIVNIPEIYEDKIVNISLNAVSNGQYIDQLYRKVYIPAAPYSDVGLIVNIDTINTDKFPEVNLIFNAREETTERVLTSLEKKNIFLYEDQTRIHDFTIEKDTSGGSNQADIIFVLDVTGSMAEEINGVKNNIVEFADSLSNNDIDFRLGMVTFLDKVENVYNFISDVQQFKQYVSQQYAHGGGGYAENSLDALVEATQFDFRPSANRVIIWITDASYHINNSYTQFTINDVVNAMLEKSIVTDCIGNKNEQTAFYDPIVIPTGGEFYDITGNFQDILLDISRMSTSSSYAVSYTTSAAEGTTHEVKLDVHYAGLGGNDKIEFTTPQIKRLQTVGSAQINCYPNPFNPSIHIDIKNPMLLECEVNIFNILGQNVRHFSFDSGQESIVPVWNAKTDIGKSVGNGIYFIQTIFKDNGQKTFLPIQKIIYTK